SADCGAYPEFLLGQPILLAAFLGHARYSIAGETMGFPLRVTCQRTWLGGRRKCPWSTVLFVVGTDLCYLEDIETQDLKVLDDQLWSLPDAHAAYKSRDVW